MSIRGESHPQHTYILYGRNHVAEHILGLETVNIEWMYHISRYSRLKMVCVVGGHSRLCHTTSTVKTLVKLLLFGFFLTIKPK